MLCAHTVETNKEKRMTIKTFSELKRLTTFEERYKYLRLSGVVGESTFGFDRQLNQMLYMSRRWKQTRDIVIIRDGGCDLGIDGREVYGRIIIHHMNPIIVEDIEEGNENIFNPEFLICTSPMTHNAIHYGDASLLPQDPIIRTKNDTCPWK